MFMGQHGICAICLRMASETPCVDHCLAIDAARHLVCDDCVARYETREYDRDIARLVAAYEWRVGLALGGLAPALRGQHNSIRTPPICILSFSRTTSPTCTARARAARVISAPADE